MSFDSTTRTNWAQSLKGNHVATFRLRLHESGGAGTFTTEDTIKDMAQLIDALLAELERAHRRSKQKLRINEDDIPDAIAIACRHPLATYATTVLKEYDESLRDGSWLYHSAPMHDGTVTVPLLFDD